MDLGFSRTLAIIFGTALPLLGIVRMFTGTSGDPTGFFVDLVNGAFLLVGAWRVGVVAHSGQRFLAAAWGLTVGLFYASLQAQIQAMSKPSVIETPIPPEWAAAGTGFGLLLSIIGLITCLRSTRKHK
jgi:hypothetical protein